MPYQRKTRDIWVVQGYYGSLYGWEDVNTEETRLDGRRSLREYNENETNIAHRLVKRREKIEETK